MTAPLRDEAEEARTLLQTLLTLGQVYADEPDDVIQTLLEGETSFVEAVSAAVTAIQYDEALIEAAKAMRAEIEHRIARFEERAALKRQAVLSAMREAGVEGRKFELPQATVSVTQTGGSAVEIVDEAEIPARFWKPSDPKLAKTEIAKALKAGEEVPGARLADPRPTLTIKSR